MAGVVEKYGLEKLAVCTLLAGLLLIVFGLFERHGVRFLISGIHAQPLHVLERAGRVDRYGRENFVASLDEALSRANALLAEPAGPA